MHKGLKVLLVLKVLWVLKELVVLKVLLVLKVVVAHKVHKEEEVIKVILGMVCGGRIKLKALKVK